MKFASYTLSSVAMLCAMATMTSCGLTDSSKARSLMSEAEALYEQGKLNDAKLMIDSLNNAYPKEIEERRGGLLLKMKIELKEKVQTLNFTDSMLVVANQAIETMKQNFSFIKSEYDEEGRYICSGMEPDKNANKTYLYGVIYENGKSELVSNYCGGKNLEHVAVRVLAADGTSCSTQEVPYNDGSNYRYKSGGNCHEIVTFINEKDGNIMSFIALNNNQDLVVELMGTKNMYKYKLDAKGKKTLSETFEFKQLLEGKKQLTQQNTEAKLRIDDLTQKIAAKESETK